MHLKRSFHPPPPPPFFVLFLLHLKVHFHPPSQTHPPPLSYGVCFGLIVDTNAFKTFQRPAKKEKAIWQPGGFCNKIWKGESQFGKQWRNKKSLVWTRWQLTWTDLQKFFFFFFLDFFFSPAHSFPIGSLFKRLYLNAANWIDLKLYTNLIWKAIHPKLP